MTTFAFTYSVTTEESAADGDHADHGFYVDGWEYSMNEPETRADILANGQDYRTQWEVGDLRSIIETAKGLGICASEGLQSVDPACDRAFFEKGEHRHYALHIQGTTLSTYARIVRLIGG